ncbi:Mth938-like domain-containing protein [Sphingomonas morindae]|uniref:Mth938-like domain-containing protein n=1 Tax=Sphingomonas morindae TaxID=1541170 RepID=A0ABY4XAD8_9SPHN|nr:Mth938-like domain-containing protein [Sphingomonas morindae]USI73789.1 Mth938-like domain-containing protein [Sphingomonas morindae]
MARFVPEEAAAGPVLQGVGAGGFRVDGTLYRAVQLSPSRAIAWTPPALEALSLDDLAPLLDPAPEFLLIGTGARLRRPSPALLAAAQARGIGIDLMDSRAAARAWVIVRGEGREVAVALFPLDA